MPGCACAAEGPAAHLRPDAASLLRPSSDLAAWPNCTGLIPNITQVCNGPALGLFTASELELLICGLPHLDFDALEAAAKYEGYDRWASVMGGSWSCSKVWKLKGPWSAEPQSV